MNGVIIFLSHLSDFIFAIGDVVRIMSPLAALIPKVSANFLRLRFRESIGTNVRCRFLWLFVISSTIC